MLKGVYESGSYPEVIYVAPNNLDREAFPSLVTEVMNSVGQPDTGAALLIGNQTVTVVIPPVPLSASPDVTISDVDELQRLLSIDRTIAVILLRLGRYAVSILEGENVVESKTGTRYVKNRHRAGGASQRRFERSRDRLVRELFDKTCRTAKELMSSRSDHLDHIILGGEKITIRHFIDRCHYVNRMEDKILDRRLVIRVPNQRSLKTIGVEAWKSQVTVFKYS